MKQLLLAILLLFGSLSAQARDTYNFNSDWELGNKKVTLPHAWNENESYERLIDHLSDSVVWYRKHFRLPKMQKGSKVFVEFEGARQMAEVYLNGHRLGMSENGVMAFGFELTPYLKKGDNYIEVKTDNDWNYKEQATGSKFQWNNKNFNVNYGGLCKNVYLHIMPAVYQTLPLYSTLGTTGTYIYAQDIDVNGRKATIHAEAEVSNSSKKPLTTALEVLVLDAVGKQVAHSCKHGSFQDSGSPIGGQSPLLELGLWLSVRSEDHRGGRHRNNQDGIPQNRLQGRHDLSERPRHTGSRLCTAHQ